MTNICQKERTASQWKRRKMIAEQAGGCPKNPYSSDIRRGKEEERGASFTVLPPPRVEVERRRVKSEGNRFALDALIRSAEA
jgi:hypothetical protein